MILPKLPFVFLILAVAFGIVSQGGYLTDPDHVKYCNWGFFVSIAIFVITGIFARGQEPEESEFPDDLAGL